MASTAVATNSGHLWLTDGRVDGEGYYFCTTRVALAVPVELELKSVDEGEGEGAGGSSFTNQVWLMIVRKTATIRRYKLDIL